MAYVSKRKNFEVGDVVYVGRNVGGAWEGWDRATVIAPPVLTEADKTDHSMYSRRSYVRQINEKVRLNTHVYVQFEHNVAGLDHPRTDLVINKKSHILPEQEGSERIAAVKAEREREQQRREQREQEAVQAVATSTANHARTLAAMTDEQEIAEYIQKNFTDNRRLVYGGRYR